MTVTIAPEVPADAAQARADFLAALAEARMFFRYHPDARLPQSPLIQVRPRGRNREEKIADLGAIAASWGVPVLRLDEGTLHAEVVFGPLTIAASVAAPVQGTTEWLENTNKLRAA